MHRLSRDVSWKTRKAKETLTVYKVKEENALMWLSVKGREKCWQVESQRERVPFTSSLCFCLCHPPLFLILVQTPFPRVCVSPSPAVCTRSGHSPNWHFIVCTRWVPEPIFCDSWVPIKLLPYIPPATLRVLPHVPLYSSCTEQTINALDLIKDLINETEFNRPLTQLSYSAENWLMIVE